MNLKGSVRSEGPRGLAYALASELRAARSEAQKSGRLVAVCFPSDLKGNSISKGCLIRRGDQLGKIFRTVSYEGEFGAFIFLGRWEASPAPKIEGLIPDPWATSVRNELCLFFRPDGTAFSKDLIPVKGRFAILVASALSGSSDGPEAMLTGATDPNTVWVGDSGMVEVEENRTPVGNLPPGETVPAAAELKTDSITTSTSPELLSAAFLPEQVRQIDSAGVGQNFISIHPEQKDGKALEYGTATIELKVHDQEGGPLHYVLSAEGSHGDGGAFTVPDHRGVMRYVFDRELNRHVWYTSIAWRPPPGTRRNTVYQLSADITDPDGNVLTVSSEANLLPAVSILPPSRLVMCTDDDELYLANLDGANEILISRDGPEHSPFFSADGSHIFSLHDLGPGRRQLRRRTADGSRRFAPLTTLIGDYSTIRFDPSFTFAAIASPRQERNYPWGRVDYGNESESFTTGSSRVLLYNVVLVNLMSRNVIPVSDTAKSGIEWNMLRRHRFYYTEVVESRQAVYGAQEYHEYPGYVEEERHLRLEGFPSRLMPVNGRKVPAYGKIFNPANRDWYLEVDGTTLLLKNEKLLFSREVDQSPGGYEHQPDSGKTPSWSADGTRVVYIKTASSERTLISKTVLREGLDAALDTFPVDARIDGRDITMAQLAPWGWWVYYLRGDVLYRSRNGGNGRTVNLSYRLGKGVKSYVISP